MAGQNRQGVLDARRHNLKALNPHVNRPALAPSLTAIERGHGLRFILQTAEAATPRQVAAALGKRHGLAITVKRLFGKVDSAADANGMDRYFLATLPGLARRDIKENVFDVAYALGEETPGISFVSVEPDIPHAVFHGLPEVEIAGDLTPCNVGADAPPDNAWHLRTMRVPRAWALPPPDGGARFGQGTVIGHIDTGWADHDDFDPARIDLARGWDFVDDDPIPRDPLERGSFLGGPASPGHGAATSSVIVGRGGDGQEPDDPELEKMWGVAPRATLVPIRAIRFVFFALDGDVARAIQFAADSGCQVISMSLGGIPTPALEAAVNYAVARNLLVCAAAGNCIEPVIVGPAIYPNCIAVAGCNIEDRHWAFSSRGAAVAVTAPAENVWASRRVPGNSSTAARTAGQGTSFAVASVAGVAALWLAFHGRQSLRDRYGGRIFLQHVFRHLLQQTARPSDLLPAGLFGSGIVDAEALLSAPLPDPGDVAGPQSLADLAVLSQTEVIAAMYDHADAGAVRARLAALLGNDSLVAPERADALDLRAAIWGAELIHILAQDQAAYRQFGADLAAGDAPLAGGSMETTSQTVAALGRSSSRSLSTAIGV